MKNTITSDFSLAKLLPIMNTNMCLLGLDYGEKDWRGHLRYSESHFIKSKDNPK